MDDKVYAARNSKWIALMWEHEGLPEKGYKFAPIAEVADAMVDRATPNMGTINPQEKCAKALAMKALDKGGFSPATIEWLGKVIAF